MFTLECLLAHFISSVNVITFDLAQSKHFYCILKSWLFKNIRNKDQLAHQVMSKNDFTNLRYYSEFQGFRSLLASLLFSSQF